MRHEEPQFKFRIPKELKARLEGAAKAGNRTLTAEILHRLDMSFEIHATEQRKRAPEEIHLDIEAFEKLLSHMKENLEVMKENPKLSFEVKHNSLFIKVVEAKLNKLQNELFDNIGADKKEWDFGYLSSGTVDEALAELEELHKDRR